MAASFEGPGPEPMAMEHDSFGPWFRTLVHRIQTGVVVVNGSGAPILANDAARQLLGLGNRPDGDSGLDGLRDLLPPALRQPAVHGDLVLSIAVPRLPETQPRRIRLHAFPLRGPERGRLVLVEDVTREEALQESLLLANRMRIQDQLRSQLHDLKAPLNALALNLELLGENLREEGTELGGERIDMVGVLQREVLRLGRFLEAILRPGSGPRRQVGRLDLRRVAREVTRLVRPAAAAAHVQIQRRVQETPVLVRADGDQVKQALLNVVLNAIDAVPEGGEVKLVVDREPGMARMVVEDDGCGIPEELIERVFDFHFTTKEGGSGIGLNVARSLVEAQGGRLSLESRLGVGTKVLFSFQEAG